MALTILPQFWTRIALFGDKVESIGYGFDIQVAGAALPVGPSLGRKPWRAASSAALRK
jgi:hypothetical protein